MVDKEVAELMSEVAVIKSQLDRIEKTLTGLACSSHSERLIKIETGEAIRLADETFVNFLILIQEIGMENKPVFSDLIKLHLEYSLEYYKDK